MLSSYQLWILALLLCTTYFANLSTATSSSSTPVSHTSNRLLVIALPIILGLFTLALVMCGIIFFRRQSRSKNRSQRLHSRWGDSAISAPVEGGWNQMSSINRPVEKTERYGPGFVPGYGSRQDSRNTPRLSEDDSLFQSSEGDDKPHKLLTSATRLPWKPGIGISRSQSPSSISQRPSKTKWQKTANPPVFVYKPASENYLKDLSHIGKGPDSAHPSSDSESPTVIYKPASEEYFKSIPQLGNNLILNPVKERQYHRTTGSDLGSSVSSPVSGPGEPSPKPPLLPSFPRAGTPARAPTPARGPTPARAPTPASTERDRRRNPSAIPAASLAPVPVPVHPMYRAPGNERQLSKNKNGELEMVPDAEDLYG